MGTNHGVVVGTGVAYTNGVVGQGFRTAFSSRHIEVPHSASLTVTGAFTVEGWIRWEGRFGGEIFSKYSTAAGRAGWYLEHKGDSGQLALHVDGDGVPFNGVEREVITATNVVPKGVFKHVAVTCNPAAQLLRIFVDGLEMPTSLIRGGTISQVFPTVERFRISGTGSLQGPNVTTLRFEGTIDEVGFYARALDVGEIAAIAAAGIAGKCPPCAPLPTGAIAWWRGEGNALDYVGANHANQTKGSPQFVPGFVGSAMKFDGNDGFAVSDRSGLDFGAGDSFTIEAWVRIDGTFSTDSMLVEKRQAAGPVGYSLSLLGPNQVGRARHLFFNVQTSNNPGEFAGVETPAILDAGFHHVAAVLNRASNSLSIYLDGVLQESASAEGIGSLANSGRFAIGHNSDDTIGSSAVDLNGAIDELSIFNRALTPAEIQAVFEAGSAGKCPPCTPLPTEAVAWWRAEDSLEDTIGGFHGVPGGGIAFAPGKVGQAFSFDGVDDLVQIANAPSLNPAALTLEAWVNPSRIKGDSRIVSKERRTDSCDAPYVSYSLDIRGDHGTNAVFYFTTSSNAVLHQLNGTSAIPVNQFTHLAATYDGAMARLYVNGALQNTLARAGTIQVSETPLTIGNAGIACRSLFNGTVEFDGLIDEVSLYSRALSSNEIATLFAAGASGKCSTSSTTLTLAPLVTNTIVGQSITFTATGGLQPHTFSLATNASGGSIHPFSGVYVAGPIPNVSDTVRVRDAFGTNVVAAVSVQPDLTPRPDLAFHSLATPAIAASSASVELVWVITNRGTVTASAPWTERLFLSADPTAGDDLFLAAFLNNVSLAPGGFLVRTQSVAIPVDSPAGATRFVLQVDADGQVNENNEGNNLVVATVPTAIAAQLFLTTASGPITEGNSNLFTVTRNGHRSATLTVALNSTDPGELAVPASVVVPAGTASVSFVASAIADGAFDGSQAVTVSASAPGFVGATVPALVLDGNVPRLTFALATNRVSEGDSVAATVTREVVGAAPLVVDVSNEGGQIAYPALVTIPAGTNRVSFAVVAVGDTAVERTATVTLHATAAAFLAADATLVVDDDDLPVVTITVANPTIGEGAGANATLGTVTRDRNSPRALVIALASGHLAAARVPASVTVPAGQTQASFPIAAVDDTNVDGTQTVAINGTILETGSGLPVGNAVAATLAVTDDDGPALRLILERELVGENLDPAVIGTVTRNNGTAGALNVTLASSDTTEATVPPNVTIPSGGNSVSFAVRSLNDGTNDGNQSVSISAASAGFAPAAATLVVSDTDLPDLVLTRLIAPTNALTGALVDVTVRLENQGLAAAGTNFTQRVLLSTDAQAGGDTLLSQATFNGTLPVGLFIEQTARVRMPQAPGTYWIVAAADVNSQVAEGLENNNTRVTTDAIVVEKAYAATVSVDVDVAPTGTPILLHGHATRTTDGTPAAFEPVSVHLAVRGTQRILAALTDAAGNYAVLFQPLPGEAGVYAVSADHPGVVNPPSQDSFTLLGLSVDPPSALRVIAGTSVTNRYQVRNLGNVPLSGLTATAIAGPPNLSIALTFGSSVIGADGTVELQSVVTSPAGLAGSATFRIRLGSAQGAAGEFDLPVIVESLQPRLVATPASLATGMRRGGVTTVQFAVTNGGGAASGPIAALLPPLPWLAVSGGANRPPLVPGEGMTITLSLTPPADLPLGDHAGSIVVSGGNSSVAVPFTFRALSDLAGSLRISAVDELTFYAEGSPKVTNASIRLSDPASGATVLATNLAGRTELVLPDLPEAFYTLRLEAPNHAPYQETFLLEPARTNDVIAFLSRQSVRYTWTVEPVVIEDRYEVTVETVFETSVPLPVITVEPQVIDLSQFPGETKQVDVTIRNRGLLAAQNMRIDFGSHPNLRAIPLINVIGELPAQGALTIPVTFQRVGAGAGSGEAGEGGGNGSGGAECQLGGKIEWTIDCAGQQITHVVPLAAINLSDYGVTCGTSALFFSVAGGPPGGVNFAAIGGGLASPGYTAPISFAEKSVCDPCFQKVGGGLVQNCLPLLPLPLFDDEVGPQEDCEGGAGTAQQFIDCMQDALDEVEGVVSEPLEDLSELGENIGGDTGGDLSDASGAVSNGLDTVGDILDKLQCLSPLLDPCVFGGIGPIGGGSGGGSGDGGGSGADGFMPVSDPAAPFTAPLTNRIHQALAYVGRHTNLFGSDLWFRGTNLNTLTNWLSAFRQRVANGSQNGPRVAPAERSTLLALPVPAPVTLAEATRFIDRWNRTVDYYEAGRMNRTDVPPGQSLDFIARDERLQVLAASRAAHSNAVAEGFRDVAHAFNFTRQEMLNRLFANTGGVCAKVRLRLEQEAVISRDAFQARLEIENSTTSPLDQIGVSLLVTDEAGADRTELFQLRPPTLDGLSGVDGAGLLPAQSTGAAAWFLVPDAAAAATNRARYFVSGTLAYRQDGARITVPLAPTAIDVLPTPKLVVDYFHERDVFSDDPFTAEVEPAVPYSLAIRVRNEGFGTAKDFRITSAQPEIVDNEKGLFIHFEIIATEVAGRPLSPALTADFGDILPGATTVGRWLFRSSLQGLFTSYDARFEHVSGLGDRRFSLIDRVNIHEMIHVVQADRALEDGRPDFLANDLPDLRDMPDTLHFSHGGQAPVAVITNGMADAPATAADLSVQFAASLDAGWNYLRAPDPANGQFRLREVRRADTSRVAVETNAWRTDRTFIGFGQRPARENILHLLDFSDAGGTHSYTLIYETVAQTRDTNAPVSAVATLPPTSTPSFSVEWNGDDGAAGSGIAYFDVYVSDQGGPFTNWLGRTTARGAVFEGAAGRTYAFFSRATDAEGNTEAAPGGPDTVTSTVISNRPPTLAFPSELSFDEGTDIGFNVVASDPDAGQTLTFELASAAPAGLFLNPVTGRITFATSEGTGPASFPLTVRVRDNGAPPASVTASATLTVREVNRAPSLAPIADRLLLPAQSLRLTNLVTDLDLPLNTIRFSLGAGAPANASMDAQTGILRWTPTSAQRPGTNRFAVIATDNGSPALSATQSFTVIVRGQRSYFTLGLGVTNLFGGGTSSVPVWFITGFDLDEASVRLDFSGGGLSGFQLVELAPAVALASLEPLGSSASRVRFVLDQLAQDSMQTLAQLAFVASDSGPSHVTALALSQPSAITASGEVISQATLESGYVVVVNAEPILVATKAGTSLPTLTVFGQPGRTYRLEKRPALESAGAWQLVRTMTLDGPSQTIALAPEDTKAFFRARE